jgi:hypothetical protein
MKTSILHIFLSRKAQQLKEVFRPQLDFLKGENNKVES